MSGLPPDILNPLRSLLEQLDQLRDANELPALFELDRRLSIWRRRLPDMSGLPLSGRVNHLIAYLLPLKDRDGRSGLVLFLQVLGEELDPQDANQRQLAHMVQRLDAWFKQTVQVPENAWTPDDYVLVRVPRSVLLKLLLDHFNVNELKMICFKLAVTFDDLPGESRDVKAMELIEYLDRRGSLPELIIEMKRQRPNIKWPVTPPPPPDPVIPVTEQLVNFDHFQVILRMQPTTWGLQVKNTSQQKLERITLSLHPPATLWLNPQRLKIGDLNELATSAEMSLSVASRPSDNASELVIKATYLASGVSDPIRAHQNCHLSP